MYILFIKASTCSLRRIRNRYLSKTSVYETAEGSLKANTILCLQVKADENRAFSKKLKAEGLIRINPYVELMLILQS